eukprot:923500-Amphidinium_carterae.3
MRMRTHVKGCLTYIESLWWSNSRPAQLSLVQCPVVVCRGLSSCRRQLLLHVSGMCNCGAGKDVSGNDWQCFV